MQLYTAVTTENLKVKNCLEIRLEFSEILYTGSLLEEEIEAIIHAPTDVLLWRSSNSFAHAQLRLYT